MRVINCFKYLVFLLGAIGLFGCSREEGLYEMPSNQMIQVQALMGFANGTSSTSWKNLDAFGLYIKPNTSSDFTAVLESNRKFTYSAGNSAFELVGTPIYYPQLGSVDLIGYAPYKQGIGNTYSVDVSNQVDLNAIDLLYSNNAKSIAKSSTAVPLNFYHQLSKISFKIRSDQEVPGLDAAAITLKGFYDKAEFNLATGTLSNPVVSVPSILLSGSNEGIIIPNTGLTGREMEITIDNDTWSYMFPDTEVFQAGKRYEYTITVIGKSISVEVSQITSWTNNGTVYETEPTNALPLEYVYIPAGTFQMGAPDSSGISSQLAMPQHWVKISKGFYMSKHETTIAQYAEFLNALGVAGTGSTVSSRISHTINGQNVVLFTVLNNFTPSYQNNSWSAPTGRENYSMCNVSWEGALAYANWQGGTLPSEAQWEYAYRAGTKTMFYYGGAFAEEFRGYEHFYNAPSPTYSPIPVGQRLPNPWGLKDIGGNVTEWTLDRFDNNGVRYNANTVLTPEIDPVVSAAAGQDNFVVSRGGDYGSSGHYASAYSRRFHSIGVFSPYIGFRIVINP